MTLIRAKIGDCEISAKIDLDPPHGWRFWTLAGFAQDPIEPRSYGGSRCVPLAIVEANDGPQWLCAMERDGTLRLLSSHDLFPCPEQRGADTFARALVQRHAEQPVLL